MLTADGYIESLRQRTPELWVDGERVTDPVSHPKLRPAIEAVAATYALAHDPEHAELATAESELCGRRVNRFVHLFRSPEDLIHKIALQRILGRITGTCFQRCVGMDGINATFVGTARVGGEEGHERHARFVSWLRGVQERDEMLCGAMTDARGDRSKRPPEQPDAFLRVVDRKSDGSIVIRGTKLHQTGAANAHQILVMPGQVFRPGEEDFAVAAAVPVDAPGVVMVLGRQPSDERRGGPDAGNLRYGGQEVLVHFDDVVVPPERVFLDGQLDAASVLLEAFAGYHRASYGGCKPGNLDVLVGAASALASEHGVRSASHVRDKLVEMVHLTETIHGLGLAASHRSERDPSGVYTVDPLLANVCKHHVTRMPYEIVRLAEDLAGGLLGTLPSLADRDHPRIGPIVRAATGSEARGRLLRLVEWMAYGSGAIPLRLECMHGAGSPQAQRVVIERHTDWEARVALARRLAGLDG